MIKIAEVAPYGKGEETRVDEAVRKCWQIDASKIKFTHPKWQRFINDLTNQASEDLGVEGKVNAELYKLLIYETGGRFLPHKDTEKLDAMFGSLIVSLPSAFTGGELMIHHGGECRSIDFGKDNPEGKIRHAAFYADCEHEVLPVQSGYRVCLAFNLSVVAEDVAFLNQSMQQHAERLLPVFEEANFTGLNAILLDHQYTTANFSMNTLKGHDGVRARALMEAAKHAGYEAHLALCVFHQEGELGYDFDDWNQPTENGEMGEIYDESLYIDHWIDPAGSVKDLGYWSLHKKVIHTDRELDGGDPIEKDSEGYTGNAGCTMDYWYQHAAVVVWRTEEREALFTKYNFGAAKTLLSQSEDTLSPEDFEKLATCVVEELDQRKGSYCFHEEAEEALDALLNRKSYLLAGRLLDLLGSRLLQINKPSVWRHLVKVLSEDQRLNLISGVTEENKDKYRKGVFGLLNAVIKGKPEKGELIPYLELIPNQHAKVAESGDSTSYSVDEGVTLLNLSNLVGSTELLGDLEKFLCHDLSLKSLRGKITLLLLRKEVKTDEVTPYSLIPVVAQRVIQIYQAEIEREILPYSDWTRPCPALKAGRVNGTFRSPKLGALEAKELMDFMANPDLEQHDFVHNAPIREAIGSTISHLKLDLKYETIKSRRPYTLRCTKTDASYHQSLTTRRIDQETLNKLVSKYM